MTKSINKHKFYFEASRQLLSYSSIEKSIQECLKYIRDFIPADYFNLHFYNPGLGIIETLVDATVDSAELMSQITTLNQESQEYAAQALQGLKEPECIFFDRTSDNVLAHQLGINLKAPDHPCLGLDLVLDGVYLGFVSISNGQEQKYNQGHADLLRLLHDPLAMSCCQFKRLQEAERLKDIIADNARQLQKNIMQDIGHEIVGADYGLKIVMDHVHQVAALNSSVLLLGETGVGKEVIAAALHRWSPRREAPFIKVNCGAIPSGLIESELFGHEKGAFSGAISQRRGCFERADGGTLLLDEIGELPMDAQVRLLRVLQDSIVERIGGSNPIRVDTRVIASTNRDLESMVAQGDFRQDLFYRLNVFPVHIPPLHERIYDIPALTYHFIKIKSVEMGLPSIPELEPGAIDRLTDYHWPGNVRELANVIERELIIRSKGPLTFGEFNLKIAGGTHPEHNLESALIGLDQLMVQHIIRVLKHTKGKVEGPDGAAEILKINPRTLQYRMKKLGIPYGRAAKGIY